MNKRILIDCQAFENYNCNGEGKPFYKFKFGSTYECIVSEDEHLTNVIAAMYNYIALQNASITLPFWVEFPTSHQILEEGELTDMEKQYAEYGDKFPLTKVKYDNGQVTKIND